MVCFVGLSARAVAAAGTAEATLTATITTALTAALLISTTVAAAVTVAPLLVILSLGIHLAALDQEARSLQQRACAEDRGGGRIGGDLLEGDGGVDGISTEEREFVHAIGIAYHFAVFDDGSL